MDEIMQFMQTHWMEWFLTAFYFAHTVLYRGVRKRLKMEQAKNDAIAEGVQSLLRESIVQNYNKYQERECCPIYAKESIKRVYAAYHDLGGNDVATQLYNTLLAMPEEPEKEDERL